MSDLWTRLISNPYVLRSSPLVRSLFDILGLCYISEKPPLSLLGVANEPSFTQKASSRLIRKILNSCRDTSRQGVDQRGMQDLIPAVLYPLLNLTSPIPGQGQPRMQAVRTCISKNLQVCLYCTSFTCLAFEQLYIWSYFQVSQRLKKIFSAACSPHSLVYNSITNEGETLLEISHIMETDLDEVLFESHMEIWRMTKKRSARDGD